jgi:hypothetical protein
MKQNRVILLKYLIHLATDIKTEFLEYRTYLKNIIKFKDDNKVINIMYGDLVSVGISRLVGGFGTSINREEKYKHKQLQLLRKLFR